MITDAAREKMKCLLVAVASLALLVGCSEDAPITESSVSEFTMAKDMDARSRLLERIGDINNFDLPRPLVSLEEFFDGNNDWGSIGYNIPDGVAPQEFYRILRPIRERDDIADVLIEVKDLEDPDGWPSTDTIWFVSSMSREQLDELIPDKIKPDDWLTYPPEVGNIEPITVPDGMKAIGIWYD
jgi:hypothetical protein